MKLTFLMMMFLSMMFLFNKHPLLMTINMIMLTLTIAVMSGLIMKSFWFSYMITMIMLSGMLVVFIYMSSIASNKKMKSSIKIIIIPAIILIFETSFIQINEMNYTNSMNLIPFFNSTTLMTTMMSVMYLFLAMMTVSKIVYINEGPMRIKK
uniref:NADH dehydrogenase subunit 6 n=1 Tax=Phaenacantha marcida TaxID=498930 RepID=B7SMK2_9HEMI|nr:NADH dehydrogenase subunit 6 [Phaenacantha marcida]ABZ02096.1 NADH dehydrogenase subunit 6 [Phaenacantha marcida]